MESEYAAALTAAKAPLVLGNEERGVSAPVLAACRREVKIGGRGKIQSLNVAQAAAVFIHALA